MFIYMYRRTSSFFASRNEFFFYGRVVCRRVVNSKFGDDGDDDEVTIKYTAYIEDTKVWER